MLEGDVREDDDARVEDVGRVVPPAEAGLDDGDVDLGGRELGERGGGQRLELGRADRLGRRSRTRARAASRSASSPADADPLGPGDDVRRRVRADAHALGERAAPRPSRAVVVLPFVPTTWIALSPRCGSPSAAGAARIRPSPNSSGHGARAARPSQAHVCSAAERIELAPVARELLALALDDLGRRVRDEALVREHPLRAGDLLAEPRRSRPPRLPFSGSRSGRTTASKIRRSSPGSSTRTPLRLEISAASCTRSSAPASSAKRSSGSGHGETISRASRAGSCAQISSVTCGMTGCRSASSRSSAASAVAAASASSLVEPRLDRLRVPVAEVVEGEAVERLHARARSRTAPRRPRPRRAPRRGGRGSSAPRAPAGRSVGLGPFRVLRGRAARRSRASSRACVPPRWRLPRSARPAWTTSSGARSASRRRRAPSITRAGRCRCRGSSTCAARRARARSSG